jgi:hypothetical protein
MLKPIPTTIAFDLTKKHTEGAARGHGEPEYMSELAATALELAIFDAPALDIPGDEAPVCDAHDVMLFGQTYTSRQYREAFHDLATVGCCEFGRIELNIVRDDV